MGENIGNSLLEEELIEEAANILIKGKELGVKIYLPVDVVAAQTFSSDSAVKYVPVQEIPSGWMGLDIGPASVRLFKEAIADAQTLWWNGPMGVFAMDKFSKGSIKMSHAIAESFATTVVGGGDTACEEAMYLSGLAKKVYMIVRKPYLRASEIMQQRVKNKENIEILFETNTLGLFGENGVEGAHLVRHKGEANEEKFDISIDGFFLAIGHKPNTDLFKGQIDLDEQGFIKVVPGTATTNIPGVFAAGDVADPIYRQGVVAAGSGAKAAIEADRFLQQQ